MNLPEGAVIRYTHLRLFPDQLRGIVHIDEEFLLHNAYTYWEAKEDEKVFGWAGPKGFSPTGGATLCRIFDKDKNKIAEAGAICSAKDHFSKKIGRNISLGRAIKQLESGNA